MICRDQFCGQRYGSININEYLKMSLLKQPESKGKTHEDAFPTQQSARLFALYEITDLQESAYYGYLHVKRRHEPSVRKYHVFSSKVRRLKSIGIQLLTEEKVAKWMKPHIYPTEKQVPFQPTPVQSQLHTPGFSSDQRFEDILARLTKEDEEHNKRWENLFIPEPKSKFALVIMSLVYMHLITTREHRKLTVLWDSHDSTVRAVFDLYEEDKDITELVDSLKRLTKSTKERTLRRPTINILLDKNTQSIESTVFAKKIARKIKKKANIKKKDKQIEAGDRVKWKSPRHPRERIGTVLKITKNGRYTIKWDHNRVTQSTVTSKYLHRV